MRLLVWRVVNKTLKFRLTFLILLTINFPEIISQGDWELIGNMTILETVRRNLSVLFSYFL